MMNNIPWLSKTATGIQFDATLADVVGGYEKVNSGRKSLVLRLGPESACAGSLWQYEIKGNHYAIGGGLHTTFTTVFTDALMGVPHADGPDCFRWKNWKFKLIKGDELSEMINSIPYKQAFRF
jgi:hypothetical protein